MLHTILMVIQFFSAASIIGLVLLQRGKGAEAGAGFGAGASGTVFGARGARTALSRATAIFAGDLHAEQSVPDLHRLARAKPRRAACSISVSAQPASPRARGGQPTAPATAPEAATRPPAPQRRRREQAAAACRAAVTHVP